MSRLFLGFIIMAGLLLVFNIPAYTLIGPMTLLLIIGTGFSLIVKRKLPHNFLATLVGLMIGPVLLCYLIRLLVCNLRDLTNSGVNSLTSALILLVLMASSFLYVRARLTHSKSNQGKQLTTNERRPILPANIKDDEEV